MICQNCSAGRIVLHAFSEGMCENNCGTLVQSGHIPHDKYCLPCSDRLKVCKECGVKITTKDPLGD